MGTRVVRCTLFAGSIELNDFSSENYVTASMIKTYKNLLPELIDD